MMVGSLTQPRNQRRLQMKLSHAIEPYQKYHSFNSKKITIRNIELMAKVGMRIGEVLKIRPVDVKDRKITLPDPKSGLETEIVYIPQKTGRPALMLSSNTILNQILLDLNVTAFPNGF